jgi:hypothetical protein
MLSVDMLDVVLLNVVVLNVVALWHHPLTVLRAADSKYL